MIDIKLNKVSIALTSAPWSTKNLTISIEFFLIAIERGDSLTEKRFYKKIIDRK